MFKSNAFIVLKKNYHGKLSVSLIISLNIIYVEYNFVCKFDILVDEFNFFFYKFSQQIFSSSCH